MAGFSDIFVGFPVFAGSGGRRSMFPDSACWVEVARPPWNKLPLAFVHLDVMYSGGVDRPVGWELTGSGVGFRWLVF
jgi:hypothetical protein